jgi:hypothetical protein
MSPYEFEEDILDLKDKRIYEGKCEELIATVKKFERSLADIRDHLNLAASRHRIAYNLMSREENHAQDLQKVVDKQIANGIQEALKELKTYR